MKILMMVAKLSVVIGASVVLILLGMAYFMVTMWMIKIGAAWAGFKAVEGNMVVLTAGIVTAAIIIGSSMQK